MATRPGPDAHSSVESTTNACLPERVNATAPRLMGNPLKIFEVGRKRTVRPVRRSTTDTPRTPPGDPGTTRAGDERDPGHRARSRHTHGALDAPHPRADRPHPSAEVAPGPDCASARAHGERLGGAGEPDALHDGPGRRRDHDHLVGRERDVGPLPEASWPPRSRSTPRRPGCASRRSSTWCRPRSPPCPHGSSGTPDAHRAPVRCRSAGSRRC